jgi:type IV pilus assembly protein PilF
MIFQRLQRVLAVLCCVAVLTACATRGPPNSDGVSEQTQIQSDNAKTVGSVMPGSQEESIDRQRARIRLELAGSYYQKGNYGVALEELRQSLLVDPNYPAAYGLLGLVYMDLGETQKAGDSFLRGLKLAPTDSDLNNSYGWFLCQNKQERASVPYFERAARNPLYATPGKSFHNAGICLRKIGDVRGAEAFLLQAFRVDPNSPVAMFNLAEIYLQAKDAEKSRFYTERLLGTYEANAQMLWLALRVERLRGNSDTELSLASRLRRLFPASLEASLLEQGKFND